MIPVLIFCYFLFGLWSAERVREKTQEDMSWGVYAATVLVWPAFWFMYAIAADIPETEDGDGNEFEDD